MNKYKTFRVNYKEKWYSIISGSNDFWASFKKANQNDIESIEKPTSQEVKDYYKKVNGSVSRIYPT